VCRSTGRPSECSSERAAAWPTSSTEPAELEKTTSLSRPNTSTHRCSASCDKFGGGGTHGIVGEAVVFATGGRLRYSKRRVDGGDKRRGQGVVLVKDNSTAAACSESSPVDPTDAGDPEVGYWEVPLSANAPQRPTYGGPVPALDHAGEARVGDTTYFPKQKGYLFYFELQLPNLSLGVLGGLELHPAVVLAAVRPAGDGSIGLENPGKEGREGRGLHEEGIGLLLCRAVGVGAIQQLLHAQQNLSRPKG